MDQDLVIVGGSYAAAQIVASTRAAGYAAPIRLISAEPDWPYQRPPLSKGFLLGKVDAAALPIRPKAFYRDNAIDVILGTRVTAIDRASRAVVTAAGERLRYGQLVLAVGSHPRMPSIAGIDLDGVMVLRTLADAVHLRDRLPDVASAVVIGGGFIGLEVAAVLATLGKAVTVLEAEDRLLGRGAGAPLAAHVAAVHRARGVDIRLQTSAARLVGERGCVRSVVTSDGATLPADLVVVGIGVVPQTALADAAGLACTGGIDVDSYARTADPSIFAIGDCSWHPSGFARRSLRLESVQHALDQAKAAGATIAGRATPYDAVPWFWSDQHDMKLQMVGLTQGWSRHAVRGAVDGGRFSIFYWCDDRLTAIESVNRPAEHMVGRRLLACGARISPDEAADEGFDLSSRVVRTGNSSSPA